MLFLGMFCGTAPGLTVIGNIKPIAQWLGSNALVVASTVSVLAVGNAAGRILWGLLHDTLTAENLSAAFGQSIALDTIDGRYFARRVRSRAAHRRRA